MRTLLIHHLEPEWEPSYRKFGTSFEQLERKFAKSIRVNKPDRVILTRFEDYRITADEYPNLINFVDSVESYGYGWTADMFADSSQYCEGGNHSEVVEITDWVRELSEKRVYVGGAFKGECLEDIEIALRHVGAKFTMVSHLCVG